MPYKCKNLNQQRSRELINNGARLVGLREPCFFFCGKNLQFFFQLNVFSTTYFITCVGKSTF